MLSFATGLGGLLAAALPTDAPPPVDAGHYIARFDPFALKFPEGWWLPGIRWYGLAYIAGFAVAAWLMWLYAKRGRLPLSADARSTLLTALLVGVLAGGRLGYMLLYDFGDFVRAPWIFFKVWEGGMASHGGFIGGILAAWWFGRASGLGFLRVCDLVATLAPPGIFLGRLANFINGELWGVRSDVPWAMIFPVRDPHGIIVGWTDPRHPSQLYEAALEGLLLAAFVQWRWWRGLAPGTPGARPAGQLAGEFLLAYALVRIVAEAFREPDAALILGLSRGTFFSLFMIVAGLGYIAASRLALKRT